MNPKDISIEAYNYHLPDERIAKYPLPKRDESRLLLYRSGIIEESQFKNLSDYLPANSLLVANNTKVIQARLEFYKESGARIEVFCLEPHKPNEYELNFASTGTCDWVCIIGNLKKWKSGPLTKIIEINNRATEIQIERIGQQNDAFIIRFNWENPTLTFSDILENLGNIPIPPYLHRTAEKNDLIAYQTIYSKHKGSVAAPTAGLHFTDEVFAKLNFKGITQHEITLHVGAGTFKPVKSDFIGQHEMHTEFFVISSKTLPAIIDNLGNITAVGTTTVRTLESFYWLGVKLLTSTTQQQESLHLNQWECYELDAEITVADALNALHNWVIKQETGYVYGSTSIMIAPGYNFKVVNRLITNFHQPKSTLLLLISAIVGIEWQRIYEYALQNNFRFLSYGDSCLLENKKGQ